MKGSHFPPDQGTFRKIGVHFGKSGYISENRGTVLEKSRHGRVYPAIFRTRQGESGRRPISCVRFTL